MFRRFLGASPSIVLAYDHFVGGRADALEESLDEVGRYYRWVKLSELIERLRKGRASGLAAIAFTSARKSVYLQAAPLLVGREIPFTTFLHPDCVGLNRLPPREEFAHFQGTYGDRVSLTTDEFARLLSDTPEEAEETLLGFRSTLGPLRIDRLDPTLFLSTWGKIVDIPPALQELGFHATFSPRLQKKTEAQLNFIRQQTRVPTRVAFYAGSDAPADAWTALGIEGVLTTERGMIQRETSAFRLPQWRLEKSGE